MNDKINVFMNWLAFDSPVLTERFQLRHLVVNYSILALALALCVVGVVGTWGIMVACVPGALIFLASVQAMSWRMAAEGKNPLELLLERMMGV